MFQLHRSTALSLMALLATFSSASHAFTNAEEQTANVTAANFAKVANTLAARLFELGPRFTTVYPPHRKAPSFMAGI